MGRAVVDEVRGARDACLRTADEGGRA